MKAAGRLITRCWFLEAIESEKLSSFVSKYSLPISLVVKTRQHLAGAGILSKMPCKSVEVKPQLRRSMRSTIISKVAVFPSAFVFHMKQSVLTFFFGLRASKRQHFPKPNGREDYTRRVRA